MYDQNFTQQPAPKRSIWKMKRTYAGGFAALVILGAITNGGKNDTTSDAKTPSPVVTVTATPSPSETSADDALKDVQASNSAARKDLKDAIEKASKSAEAAAQVETAELPDLVGMNHQAAQDAAQAAGFFNLRERDGSGQDRMLLWDRNWKVCAQEPAPGSHGVEITVTLTSVKEDESC
jgi:ABC-type glycerol-3-phosphate transport system substrate-binding protein